MKILDFFKRGRDRGEAGRTFGEILPVVRPHSKPALMLRKSSRESASYLGGDPHLPPGVDWPAIEGQLMTFLASLDLGEIGVSGAMPWLPDSGRLLFFYDAENQPWGFDPADRGGWSVVYVRETGPEVSAINRTLPKFFVEFEKIDSLPDYQRFDDLGIAVEEGDVETYIDGYYEWLGGEDHQIGGYPRPVQGDQMELDCQLVSNGVYLGDASGYQTEEAKRLAPGAADWRLLLEFSSDDDLGVMWGDLGELYFWVREQDARKGDFSNVWLVLQCS